MQDAGLVLSPGSASVSDKLWRFRDKTAVENCPLAR